MRETCKSCGTPFSEANFYRAGAYWMSECKECWKLRVHLRRLTNPNVQVRDRARSRTPERVKRQTLNTRIWRERNPEAYRAHNALNNAVRDGRVTKKPCEVCAATTGIHGHHRDYSKPLDVIWLCARCHHRLHSLFPELEGENKRAG